VNSHTFVKNTIPFCEPCAREQEAYFAIGELTGGKHSLRSKPLAKALGRMRRERAGSREGMAAEMRHGLSGVDESKPLALRSG
jgi:hypothetical protein